MLADTTVRSGTKDKSFIRERLGTSRSVATPCQGGCRGFDPRFPAPTFILAAAAREREVEAVAVIAHGRRDTTGIPTDWTSRRRAVAARDSSREQRVPRSPGASPRVRSGQAGGQ